MSQAHGPTIPIHDNLDPGSLTASIARFTSLNQPIPTTIRVGNATNATPIVITTVDSMGVPLAHGLATADQVFIDGVGGNLAANGYWTITFVSATTFSLNGSVGSAAYTSGGTVFLAYRSFGFHHLEVSPYQAPVAVFETTGLGAGGTASIWVAIVGIDDRCTSTFSKIRLDNVRAAGTVVTAKSFGLTVPRIQFVRAVAKAGDLLAADRCHIGFHLQTASANPDLVYRASKIFQVQATDGPLRPVAEADVTKQGRFLRWNPAAASKPTATTARPLLLLEPDDFGE